MKHIQKLTIFGSMAFALMFSSNVFAGQIENLDVTPAGSQILIEWDLLTDSEMFDEDGGYVLQYSTVQNDIRNDKLYKNQVKKSVNTLTLRAAGFERNETYFFRIYSLRTDGRKKHLNNGSKILKWEWKSNGDVDSEFVAANDPVIVDDSSSSLDPDFGKLRAEKFDTSAHFKWSTPDLGSREHDGFVLVLSESDDLSSPVAEVVIPTAITTSFIEGLNAETTYYAAGYLKNGSTRFAKGETISFKTLAPFTSRQQAIYARRILKRGNLGIRHALGGTTVTPIDTTTTTSTPTTNTEVTARIAELKALIKKYQTELASLQRKTTSSNASSTGTSRSVTTRSSSSRSRLDALRERLRNRNSN